MRSKTDETIDDAERRILEKAKKLFAAQGFYGTDRTKIRIAAHVSESTISTRFEDEELTPKEMILVQILETCWRNINHLIETLPTTTDLAKRQKEILSIILDTFESDKELSIIFVAASREVHKLGGRLMEGSIRKVVQAIESVFAKGQTEGVFRKHVSPKSMQRAFFGTVEEFLHSWVLRETRDYQTETSRQELERTIDSLLFGFSLSEESLKAELTTMSE